MRSDVLAIVQAGGKGSRMDVLTRERAKPALPVAGVFQLVDFPLSNLSHSGISDVWLSVQFHATSLQEQVANGRPWDLDRTRGGLRLMMPEPVSSKPGVMWMSMWVRMTMRMRQPPRPLSVKVRHLRAPGLPMPMPSPAAHRHSPPRRDPRASVPAASAPACRHRARRWRAPG